MKDIPNQFKTSKQTLVRPETKVRILLFHRNSRCFVPINLDKNIGNI